MSGDANCFFPNVYLQIGKSPSVENLLQNEVLVLRKELQHAQNSHSEMLNILHETVNGIIGDRGEEEAAIAKMRQQKEDSGKLKIDITR